MNEDRIAVPLSGPGGKLAIFETKRPGRIEAGVTPVLINGTTVLYHVGHFSHKRFIVTSNIV